MRFGFRYVHGIKQAMGETIEREQAGRPFTDTADLTDRCGLSSDQLEPLAHVGALGSLGLSHREALWQFSEVVGRSGSLVAQLPPEKKSPLPEITKLENTVAGAAIVRQRPGSAKGFTFLAMEDETGMVQADIRPDLFRGHRPFLVSTSVILVEGALQKSDGTLSVKARAFEGVEAEVGGVESHDWC